MASARRAVLLVPRARPAAPVDVATREGFIADQRHPARRRRLRRTLRLVGRFAGVGLGAGVCLVVGAVGVHALRTTPALGVSQIEVLGAQRVPETMVLAAAGIEPGANLLSLDARAVEERVAALPGVRRARLVRHFPRRVALVLEERQPYALVSVGGADGLFWVDADGRVVAPERRAVPPPLPILAGVERPPASDGEPVGDRLHAGLALLRAVQRTGGRVAGRISEIDLDPADGPVLYTLEGIEVRLGHEAWDERLARLDGVLAELDERGERVERVDLRFRDLVVLRPWSRPAGTAKKGR